MNGCDIENTLEKIKENIQDLLDGIYKARKVDEAD